MNRKNIYLMYAIALLQGMVFYAPVATLYRQSQGISVFQITVIESISLVLCLVLELPWGMIADRIGYRRTMIVCCGLYFFSKIIFWQAASFGAFLLERVILSVVIAGLSGVDVSVLYLSCHEEESQKVFSIYNGMQTIGILAASIIFAAAVGENYPLAGCMTVVSYGIAALLSLRLDEVTPKEGSQSSPCEFLTVLRDRWKNKGFLLFLFAVALLNETHQTVAVFLSQLQYIRCGLSARMLGYIYVFVIVSGLWGTLSDWLTKRVGIIRLTVFLYGIASSACLGLAITRHPWISVGGILGLRISFSLFQPLQTELQNREVTTSNRATALSVNAVMIDSVGVGTNLLFGRLADVNLPAAFLLGAGLCVAGLALFLVWQMAYPLS